MENSPTTKKSFSLDWLVRGTLAKLGEMFDGLTGRNWKPASNLATSELVERLKKLLDAQARDSADKRGKFVPHNIKLLMQWDKFSVDGSEMSLKKLENELLVAAVDHINDRRYQTYAPLKFEIKPDYFTEDVKLETSFEEFAAEVEEGYGSEAAVVNVPVVADLKHIVPKTIEEEKPIVATEPEREIFVARFMANGQPRDVKLAFAERARLSVGRSRDNALWIDDAGVSKIHASLILNQEKQLTVADTGSTNGTFVGGERIAYGKAVALKDNEKIKFGTIEVEFDRQEKQSADAGEQIEFGEAISDGETVKADDGKMSINLSEV